MGQELPYPAVALIHAASGLNLIVRFKGRQSHYLVGNASTEYEDESDV
jgi:hypothetical protein